MPKLFDPTDPHPLGLPRPAAPHKNGKLLPVPWSQAADAFGPNWGVYEQSTPYRCLVCGEQVLAGKVFVRLAARDDNPIELYTPATCNYVNGVIDEGPLHDRCAALTLAHCERMRELVNAVEVDAFPYTSVQPGGNNP